MQRIQNCLTILLKVSYYIAILIKNFEIETRINIR